MKKLAALISNAGTGSNLHAIITAIKNKKINAHIVVVISDTPDAKGLQHARENNLQIEICVEKENLFPLLQRYSPDYICLAGWKQIITDSVITAFTHKILNVHPGLVPDLPDIPVKNPDHTTGLWNQKKLANSAINNFLTTSATYAGSSIHFLTHTFDFGPVLSRCFEKIKPSDTIESLYSRLKKRENKMYVKVLKKLCNRK